MRNISEINKKLLEQPRQRLYVLFLLGLGMVLFTIVFIFIPTSTEMSKTGYSIVDFQLAWYSSNINNVISAWAEIIDTAIYQTIFDYSFILGNFFVFSSVFLLSSNYLDKKSLSLSGFWFVLISSISDGIENVFTLLLLLNPTSFPDLLSLLITLFATIKFLFILFF